MKKRVKKAMILKNIDKATQAINNDLNKLLLSYGSVSRLKKAFLNKLLTELIAIATEVNKLRKHYNAKVELLNSYNALANIFNNYQENILLNF